MQNTQKLLKLCNQRNALIVPGAPNAFFARIIEDLGFEAVYVTGAGIANMQLGMPDLGLTTISEISNTVANIADVVDLPIIVDADTGFGNALNVIRTIKTLERSGASGIQLEDQVFPKKCGHFDGKKVIPTSEMVQKIHAAVDTRYDNDLQIIARTDAVVSEGLILQLKEHNLILRPVRILPLLRLQVQKRNWQELQMNLRHRKLLILFMVEKLLILEEPNSQNLVSPLYFMQMQHFKRHLKHLMKFC